LPDLVELRLAGDCVRCHQNFSVIAHDVKTFVTIIDGYLDILLAKRTGSLNDAQKQILTEMRASVGQLDHYTKQFLTYAKLGAGASELDLREGDLNLCLQELMRFWAPQFENKSIPNYLIAGELPKFCFDYHKVQHIFSNLLDNALKYTPPGGTVYVTTEPYVWERRSLAKAIAGAERRSSRTSVANCARITVTDSGPGIPPEYRQEVFEEFWQLSASEANDLGVGLGLAIARRLVHLHRGKIWVEGEPGAGSSFCVLLPFRS
jgi:two-component system sensor histidine kinase/response regulator